MAEHSGFFNALLVEGEYDRKYNANDYTDNLAVVISNGVLRSTADDLKVTASGMVVSVAPGRGWIKGHWYNNDSSFAFGATVAPTGGNRYDRVMLRFDNTLNNRKISLVYVQGTAASTPVKPTPTRTNDVYDLVLADVYIAANGTSVSVTDTRSDATLCGWVFSTSGDASFFTSLDNSFNAWFQTARDTLSSVSLFKRYNWRTVLAAQSTSVAFNIPQYDANTCFIEVYVNGMVETYTTDYTLSGSVLTFSGTLVAGTEVEVKCYKSIDGTGIMDVSDEITELQNQYATLNGISKYTYKCTGLNDNISISQIAQALLSGSYVPGDVTTAANTFLTALGGNTYLAGLAADAQITIDVVGKLGATTPFAGNGTAASRYKYFSLGSDTANTKRLIFDFSKTEKIQISCAANSDNIIFFGINLHIVNANVYVSNNGANCAITMCASNSVWGTVTCKNCKFIALATSKSSIAQYGTFENCLCHTKSLTDNAYCFEGANNSVLQVIGGEMYAYTGTQSKVGSIFNIESNVSGVAMMVTNIKCPTVAQTGYYQNYLVKNASGTVYINGVISALPSTGAGTRTITGQI